MRVLRRRRRALASPVYERAPRRLSSSVSAASAADPGATLRITRRFSARAGSTASEPESLEARRQHEALEEQALGPVQQRHPCSGDVCAPRQGADVGAALRRRGVVDDELDGGHGAVERRRPHRGGAAEREALRREQRLEERRHGGGEGDDELAGREHVGERLGALVHVELEGGVVVGPHAERRRVRRVAREGADDGLVDPPLAQGERVQRVQVSCLLARPVPRVAGERHDRRQYSARLTRPGAVAGGPHTAMEGVTR